MHLRFLSNDRQRRGSALLLVLMIVAILAVIAFGIVQMSTGNSDVSGAKRRNDKAVNCSDAARSLLMSQFRMYGTSPTQLTLNTQVDDQIMATGHYDNLAISSVTLATGFGSTGIGMSDVSNRITKVGLGGQVYRMTVVCTSADSGLDAATRQSEVEFLVRFGL